MPRGDGTGPAGMGPMTGRGAGYCAGFATPGFANPIPRGGGFAYNPYFMGYPQQVYPFRQMPAPYYGYPVSGFLPRFGLGRGIRGPGFGAGRGRGRRFW